MLNLKGEQWDDIPGLDGAYRISNYGRLKALQRWVERPVRGGFWLKEKIIGARIQTQTVSEGKREIYRLAAVISYEKKKYSVSIARLVYFLFIKKFDLSDRKIIVTYKDQDPFNISPKNLLLSNPSDSIKRAYGKQHRKRDMFGHAPRMISRYDLNGIKAGQFVSISVASQIAGISSSTIVSALRRKDGYGAGYIWQTGNTKKDQIIVPQSIKTKLSAASLYEQYITQYNLKGKRVRIHKNLREAAFAVKRQPNQIRLILLGKAFTCADSYWVIGKGPSYINIKPILESKLQKLRNSICRPVTQLNIDRKKIRSFASIAEAARFMGVDSMSIVFAIRAGKTRSYKNYYWEYAE